MKKEMIIALVDLIVSKRISEIAPIRGPRGIRGKKGEDGKDFSFEEHKESIVSIINPEIEKVKNDLIDISIKEIKNMTSSTEEDQSKGQQGPRGLRGPKGDSFNFEENRKDIEIIIKNHIDGIDFNLDSTIEKILDQKDIKLKISNLSDEERELLRGDKGPRGQRGKAGVNGLNGADGKNGRDGNDGRDGEKGARGLRGPRGEKGERGNDGLPGIQGDIGPQGPRGMRGQRGKQGEIGPQGIKGDIGPRGQRGKKGEQGDKGDIGARGPRGLRGKQGDRGEKGIDGINGINGSRGPRGFRGLNGRDGIDGQDAPYIIDVELLKSSDYISFRFYFSDGSRVETNRTQIEQDVISVVNQNFSSGGTSVQLYEDDNLIGRLRGIRSTTHLRAVYEEDTGIVEFYPSSSVGDDGVEISDSVEYFNFTGNGVTVIENDAVYNWPNLDELQTLDQKFTNPRSVNIEIIKDLEAHSGLVSGVYTGGEVTINAIDSSTFDIAAGVGYIVDFTDKADPKRIRVEWTEKIGLTIPNLSALFTSVKIDRNGNAILTSGVLPSPIDRRGFIVLQTVTHADGPSITNITKNRQLSYENIPAILDYIDKIGPINTGNSFYPFANNLVIAKEAGFTTMPFFNALGNDQDSTNLPNAPMSPVTTMSRYYQDGAGGTVVTVGHTVVDPTLWDNQGVLEPVANNKWSIQRIYFYGQMQSVATVYGQATYASANDARASIFLEDPVLPSFIDKATFVTAMILKGDCTNLSDINQAVFVNNVQALVSRGGRAPVQSVNGLIGNVDVSQKGGNYGKSVGQVIPDGVDEVLIFDNTIFEDGNVLIDVTDTIFTLQESGKIEIDASIEMNIVAALDDVSDGILRLWKVDPGGDILLRETSLSIMLGMNATTGAKIKFEIQHKNYFNNGDSFYLTFNKSSVGANTTTMVAGGTYLDIAKL